VIGIMAPCMSWERDLVRFACGLKIRQRVAVDQQQIGALANCQYSEFILLP
jgi:hypothetical protein